MRNKSFMAKLNVFLSFLLILVLCLGVLQSKKSVHNLQLEASLKETVTDEKVEKAEASFTEDVIRNFYTKIQSGEINKIKVIGDSVVAGFGTTNYSTPVNNPVIMELNGTTIIESSYDNPSWVNEMRTYLREEFPQVSLMNAGVEGASAKWANTNKEYWLNTEEDAVIVMLSSNERWSSEFVEKYRQELSAFLQDAASKSKEMIVMSPPPILGDEASEAAGFGMDVVNNVMKEISEENQYTFIPLYELFNEEVAKQNLAMQSLLDFNNRVPYDEGHRLIWSIIKRELALD